MLRNCLRVGNLISRHTYLLANLGNNSLTSAFTLSQATKILSIKNENLMQISFYSSKKTKGELKS